MAKDYTPSQRFEAIAYFMGWQGGTCHQIDAATGCPGILTLNMPEISAAPKEEAKGWFSVRTCGLEHRRKMAPEHAGVLPYWAGVIRAYWITGALGGPEFSARFGNT